MKNIFIASAMNDDLKGNYTKDCEKLLSILMKNNNLVFGGCNSGIMNISYSETKKNNNSVTSIVPNCYADCLNNISSDNEIIVNDVKERLYSLILNSDILLFLPGGYGTLCELFFMLDSKKANEHNHPIIIYNSLGYFDLLLQFLQNTYNLKFSKQTDKDLYVVIDNYNDLINYIADLK